MLGHVLLFLCFLVATEATNRCSVQFRQLPPEEFEPIIDNIMAPLNSTIPDPAPWDEFPGYTFELNPYCNVNTFCNNIDVSHWNYDLIGAIHNGIVVSEVTQDQEQVCVTVINTPIRKMEHLSFIINDNGVTQKVFVTKLLFENDAISVVKPVPIDGWIMKDVQIFSMARNRLSNLPLDLLNETKVVHTVNLSHNYFESFYNIPNMETPDSHLKVVDLSFNQLVLIDGLIGQVLANDSGIEKLYLGHNRLTNFIEGTNTTLQNLAVLDLSSNELKYLSGQLLVSMNSLAKLDLSNNPWHCSRSMCDLQQALNGNSTNITQLIEPICSTPDELSGQSLLQVELNCPKQVAALEKGDSDSYMATVIGLLVSVLVTILLVFAGLLYLHRRGRLLFIRRSRGVESHVYDGPGLDTFQMEEVQEEQDHEVQV